MQPKAPLPLVWVLLGNRQGDDNQLLALAEALGWPYEVKRLTYSRLRHVKYLRGERLLHLTRPARGLLEPPWPDLVVGVGYESMPVSRHIRRQSGGRTRLVQIGNPRTRLDDLDQVITTPQYRLEERPNVLPLPFPVGNPARTAVATEPEEQWLQGFPKPRRVVALGGNTRQWKIDMAALGRAIDYLQQQCDQNGGSLIAVTSRRTPPEVRDILKARLTGPSESLVDDFPRFAVLLSRCDEFFVTADSVSMLAEAILTGKPVGIIPIAPSARAQLGRLLRRLGLKLKSNADLSLFWRYLDVGGLMGSVDHPVASEVSDTVAPAVEAVRQLFSRNPPGIKP